MKEKCKNMTEGREVYNIESGRYGFWVSDLWWHNGFHCGECLEVCLMENGQLLGWK